MLLFDPQIILDRLNETTHAAQLRWAPEPCSRYSPVEQARIDALCDVANDHGVHVEFEDETNQWYAVPALAATLQAAIAQLLADTYGDTLPTDSVHFYTPAAWARRKECTGHKALLTATFEGRPYQDLNYGKLGSRLAETLAQFDVYYEQGYSWSVHVYPYTQQVTGPCKH